MKHIIEFTEISTGDEAWTPVADDNTGLLREIVLAAESARDVKTRLLRFPAGADTSPNGELAHDFWEEVWILEGAIYDLRLEQNFGAGSYACRPPGMVHGPWTSETGALLFEVRYTK